MITGFTETLNYRGLSDLGFVRGNFTWEKSRRKANWIKERLDWACANRIWCGLFLQAELRVLEVSRSDHLPIYLQLHKHVYKPKRRHFKFENVWLKDDECQQIVKNGWEDVGNREIMEKITLCGLKLQEWGVGGGVTNEYKGRIKVCLEKLWKLRSKSDANGVGIYNKVRWEFLQLLKKWEIYWKQRSKQFWLKEEDLNTSFFHKYASQRRRTNSV